MFKYPQGEGGRSGRIGCQPATAHRSVLPFYLCLILLLSRFVTRTLCPQTVIRKGGMGDGY
ncbi:YmjE family protein [Klebsiella quasipneumoniae]|uniref:YmjE family protein n=1 Tax=Klebsiella quasipneumoniae TaxID=1463165 RepID=UPI003B5A14ED